ncbi:unnamed protein product [Mytilus coruscus]|uniref:Uncharacterized protein n=1 Tax=Mytilus coruscus TaxID=42192 RepID=A0A6J8A3D5_MYTCO|nr:unnamed protein product [Mytilus coruscus]
MKLQNSTLLDQHKNIVAVGHDAENKYYHGLFKEDSEHDWYFFKQFTKDIHKLQDGDTDIYNINVKTFDQKKEIPARDSIDLTCLKVEEDNSLIQLKTIIIVREVCKKFFVGIDVCTHYPEEANAMVRFFERRAISFSDAKRITLIIPVILKELYDKMRINTDSFVSLFDAAIASVVNAIREMLNDPDVMDISHIICTGRLMQLQMIFSRLRETFHNIDIIDFSEPEIAALKVL